MKTGRNADLSKGKGTTTESLSLLSAFRSEGWCIKHIRSYVLSGNRTPLRMTVKYSVASRGGLGNVVTQGLLSEIGRAAAVQPTKWQTKKGV